MNYKAFWAVFLFSIGAIASESRRSLHLTLQDCLEMASNNHQKLEAADYDIDASRWKLREAEARFWPILEYNVKIAPVPQDAANAAESFFSGDITYFNAIRVGVGLPLYTFGQLDTAQKLAQQGIRASEVKREKERGKILYEVKQIYYGIQLGEEVQSIANDAIHRIDGKLKEEETTHQHAPFEIAKLKVYKVDLAKKLSEAIQKGALAREAMRVQIGLAPGQSFTLARNYLSLVAAPLKPLRYYKEVALKKRPDSSLIDIGVEAKRLEYVLERKKNLPSIGFGGFIDFGRTAAGIRNVGSTDDFNNPFNYTRAGLALEIKGKLDFHGAHARVSRLHSEFYKASIEGDLAKRGILLEVEEAYGEVLRYQQDLNLAEEKKKLARQMLFLSKTNLEVGVGEEEQYTDALQLVMQSQAEYLKSLYEYNVSVAKLEWKVRG